jgi:hypothetical protein
MDLDYFKGEFSLAVVAEDFNLHEDLPLADLYETIEGLQEGLDGVHLELLQR